MQQTFRDFPTHEIEGETSSPDVNSLLRLERVGVKIDVLKFSDKTASDEMEGRLNERMNRLAKKMLEHIEEINEK